MDDVCDAGAKATCSSANKESCSPGTTTCGACKDGFVADVGDTCVAKQACSAADSALTCASPAIKDNAGTCAGKECDASADFGDTSKACCMYDVCDAGAKAACSSANKESCSPGETICGECLSGFKSHGDTCVDVCDDAVRSGCASVHKAACSAGSTTCGGCLLSLIHI